MSSQKGVHNRIHTLRGEQFRHLQNLRGSRSHLTSANIHTVPSLPFRLLSLADPSLNFTGSDRSSPPPQAKSRFTSTSEPQPDGTSLNPPAGPAPPKSWRLNTRKDIRESAAWRAEALSLTFTNLSPPESNSTSLNFATPRIPPLSLLCLQLVLATCTISEFKDDIVPYLPPHIRRDLVRFTAVHSPLSSGRLYALWEPNGHAGGEVVAVGPNGLLRDDHFLRGHASPSEDGTRASTSGVIGRINSGEWEAHTEDGELEPVRLDEDESWDWDADDIDPPTPLMTLILLTTVLSSSTLFSFPPTLTHLALINLATPVPLHRLPNICPLLVMLDVSYNTWLGANFIPGPGVVGTVGVLGEPQQPRDLAIKAVVDLGRVDWNRWNHLKMLGFRGNYVPEGFVGKVNEERWDDIEIVL